MKSKIYPSESEEQIGFLEWFESNFFGVRIFHIPNGGHRAISVGKKMKAEGVKPGVPDLYIPAWKIWIEMKRVKGGKLSAEQEEWHDYLTAIGDTVIVGMGAKDASAKLLQVLRGRRAERIASRTGQLEKPLA
jgi:hypothetical protein